MERKQNIEKINNLLKNSSNFNSEEKYNVYLEISKIYLSLSDNINALKYLLDCVQIKQDKYIYLEIAKIYITDKLYEKALDYLYKALDENKEEYNLSIYFEIAKVYFYIGIYNKSIDYFEKVLDINCVKDNLIEYSKEIINKIYVLLRKDYIDISLIRRIEKILNIDNNVQYLVYPGNYPFDGDYDKLIKIYKKILDNEPNNSDVICFLAQTYNYLGLYDETINLYFANKERVKSNMFFDNKLLNEYEIASKKTILKSKPRNLMVVLSNKCNLQCLMCLVSKEKWDMPKNRLEEIKNLFPYLEKVMWQGGEVLLLPYFKDILKLGLNYPNMRQSIVTNFQLANEEIIELLVRNNIEITISIDGIDEKTYEKIRVNGKFYKLIENINLLNSIRKKIKNRVVLNMNVVVMRENYKNLVAFVEFAKKYDFDMICFIPINFTKSCFSEKEKRIKEEQDIFFNFSKEDAHILINQSMLIYEKAKEMDIRIDNKLHSVINNIDVYINKEKIFEQNKKEDISEVQRYINNEWLSNIKVEENLQRDSKMLCHLPWYSLTLDYNATVRPDCLCNMDKNIASLLNNSTIEQMWNNDKLQFYRKCIVKNKIIGLCNNSCIENKVNSYHLKII